MNNSKLRLVDSTEIQEDSIPSFGQWLVNLAKRIKTPPGAGIMLTVASLLYGGTYNLSYLSDPTRVLSVTSAVQCLIILIFIFVSKFTFIRGFSSSDTKYRAELKPTEEVVRLACGNIEPHDFGEIKAYAARAQRHYHNYWMALWLAWLILYAILMFMHLPQVDTNQSLSIAFKVTATFLNNCSALALLCCYRTLSRPDLLGGQCARQPDWFIWVATLFILTLLEAMLSTFAATKRLSLFFTCEWTQISAFFGWLSGINSAIVMSLYTRRLASRFMDCPIWVIVLLYAYAALQPGFGVIGKNNLMGTLLLLNFALLLKTLLFLYMIYVFRYGWLLFYFVQVSQFTDSARSKMKKFSVLLE